MNKDEASWVNNLIKQTEESNKRLNEFIEEATKISKSENIHQIHAECFLCNHSEYEMCPSCESYNFCVNMKNRGL